MTDVQRVEGFLAPLDDEYPELVALLRSVIRSRGQHFVVVEVRIHFVIVMIRWTALAPWGVEFLERHSLARGTLRRR